MRVRPRSSGRFCARLASQLFDAAEPPPARVSSASCTTASDQTQKTTQATRLRGCFIRPPRPAPTAKMSEEFREMAEQVRRLLDQQPGHPSALDLYSLYKQSTLGDVTTGRQRPAGPGAIEDSRRESTSIDTDLQVWTIDLNSSVATALARLHPQRDPACSTSRARRSGTPGSRRPVRRLHSPSEERSGSPVPPSTMFINPVYLVQA